MKIVFDCFSSILIKTWKTIKLNQEDLNTFNLFEFFYWNSNHEQLNLIVACEGFTQFPRGHFWLEVACEGGVAETTKFHCCNMDTSWASCYWEKPAEGELAEAPEPEEDIAPFSESSWQAVLAWGEGLLTLGYPCFM